MAYQYLLMSFIAILIVLFLYNISKVLLIYKKIDSYFYFSISTFSSIFYYVAQLLLSYDLADSSILIIHRLKILTAVIVSLFFLFTFISATSKKLFIPIWYSIVLVVSTIVIPFDFFTRLPIVKIQKTMLGIDFVYQYGTTGPGYLLVSILSLSGYFIAIAFCILYGKTKSDKLLSPLLLFMLVAGSAHDYAVAYQIISNIMILEYLFFIFVLFFVVRFFYIDIKTNEQLKSVVKENESKTRHLKIINELNSQINNSLDLYQILHGILVKMIVKIPAADAGIIFLGNSEDDSWEVEASIMYKQNRLQNLKDSYSKKIKEFEADKQQIFHYTSKIDTTVFPLSETKHVIDESSTGRTLYSSLYCRIINDDQLLGAIQLDSLNKDQSFTKDDEDFLRTVSSQTIVAIRNAKLYKTSENQAKRFKALHSINKSIIQTFDLKEIFNTILNAAVENIEAAQAGSISAEMDNPNKWQAIAALNYDTEVLDKFDGLTARERFYAGYPLVSIVDHRSYDLIEVIKRNYSEELAKEYQLMLGERKLYSELNMYFVIDDRPIGKMYLYCFDDTLKFSKEDISFAEGLTLQTSLAIRNAKLYNENLQHSESLQRKIQESQTIYEITKAVASTLDVDEIIKLILESVRKIIPCDHVDFFRYNNEQENLVLTDAIGNVNKDLLHSIIPIGTGAAGYAAKSRKPVRINNTQESEVFYKEIDPEDKIYNILSIPIIASTRLIGILDTVNKDNHEDFTEDDERLLEQFASSISIALENADLYNSAINYINRVIMTGDVIRTINSTFDLKTIFDTILRQAILLVPAAEAGTIFLGNKKTDVWKAESVKGYDLDLMRQINDSYSKVKDLHSKMGEVKKVQIRESDEIESHLSDLGPQRKKLHYEIMKDRNLVRSLNVNLYNKETLIGTIVLDCFNKHKFFTTEDIEFANDLADQASTAINNAKLYNENLTQTKALKRKIKESEHLAEITKAISSTLDVQTITHKILESSNALIECERLEYYNYNPQLKVLTCEDALGNYRPELIGYTIEYGAGVFGSVAEIEKPIIVNDVTKSKYFSWEYGNTSSLRNLLAVPIVSKGVLKGTLGAVNKKGNQKFTVHDAKLLQRFASNISVAVDNAQHYNNALNYARRMLYLNEINNTINKTFDLSEIFKIILEKAIEIIPAAEAGSVYIGNPENDTWYCEECIGYDLQKTRQNVESYQANIDIYNNNPFKFKIIDFAKEILPTLSEEKIRMHDSVMNGKNLNKILWVNLVIDETLIGRLHLDNFDNDTLFSLEDLEFTESLAEQSTIAIKNALLFEKEKSAKEKLDSRLKELLIVNSISTTVSMSVDMEQLLSILYSQIYAYFEIDCFFVALVDHERKKIISKVVIDQGIEMDGFEFDIGTGLSSIVVKNEKPLLLNDYETEVKTLGVEPFLTDNPDDYVTRSWYGIPLKIGDELIGVLKVESSKKNAFSKETCDVLLTLSNQVSIAIHNQNMVDEITESRNQEEKIRKAFQRFVPADVITQLLEQEDSQLFKGTNAEAVIMFTDLRDFTTMSENMDAKTVVSMLNLYFTAMANVVIEHGGIIDKFMGDAMLIIFQTGTNVNELTINAFETAKEMYEILDEFNLTKPDPNWPDLDMGIGIHRGDVIIGNIGSPQKMDYTVIGDTVNLASRLESLCKYYTTRLIISEPVLQELQEVHNFRELDYIAVKGKTKPVKIYEYLFENDPLRDNESVIHQYHESLSLFRKRLFKEAIKSFMKVIEKFPEDKPSNIHIERCINYITEPPDKNWNGEHFLSSK
jgi:GAF domain-containing protein